MYGRQDDSDGCFGILIVIALILWVLTQIVKLMVITLAYIGATPIIILDYFSISFMWIGIKNPSIAWLVLGTLIGIVVGLVQGLKRAGRPSDIVKVYIGASSLACILGIGSWIALSVQ
ncbi:MAG: hypothetical protein F6J92_39600 [Symploca sp. SIO1A3]|nr:hypothetical protein [Symploca sp. SIO1A3]